MRRRLGSRQDRDDRGAVAAFTAIVLVVLIAVTAFAVDLGMQRVARSDMQALADVVALDLARELDGRSVSELETVESSLASASRDRNRDVINFEGSLPGLAVDWGELDANGDFVLLSGTAKPSAVRVTADTEVGFAFAPAVGLDDSGGAERLAVASSDTEACFSIGSYAARLDTEASELLAPLVDGALNGNISLDAAGYRGIADADISLLDLAAELGLGSVDELLTTNVSAGDLFLAAADVLDNDGNTADADVLHALGVEVGSHTISVGDLINAESGGTAAETATINVLDLVAGTAFVANGTNAVSIPDLAVDLGLTGTALSASVKIIEKARKGCGKKGSASADTAQAEVDISGKLLSLPNVLGLSVTGGQTTISVDAASAHGLLTDVICGNETAASPSGEDVAVTKGLVGASVSTSVHVHGSIGTNSGLLGNLLGGLTGLLGTVVRIDIDGDISLTASTSDPTQVETAQYRVPGNPEAWGDAYPLGSGELGLNTTSVVAIPPPTLTIKVYTSLLGIPILKTDVSASQLLQITTNVVSAAVSTLVNPLLTTVNDALLEPLTDLLGVKLGGADVFADKPVCGNPRLVG